MTDTPTSGRGSPGSGPSPPSCRSVTTLPWRSLLRASSLGPQGPRPRLLSLPLLRPVLPRHHSRHFLALFPPGQAGVEGAVAAAVAVVGDVEQVVGAIQRRHLHGVQPGHPSTTHGQGVSMWPFQASGGEPRPPAAMLAGAPPGFLSVTPWVAPFPASSWATPLATLPGSAGWDQAALAHSFSTMALTPPVGPEWVADSRATYHTTPNPGILSSVHPPSPSPFVHYGR